jgi:hypothetical protein
MGFGLKIKIKLMIEFCNLQRTKTMLGRKKIYQQAHFTKGALHVNPPPIAAILPHY